ncbi:class I SAM-dependent methyltransferase [bacterium]|nr:class I SAM-dependent methyltransferase [bacterium]
MSEHEPWWVSLYDELVLEMLIAHRDPAEIEQTVAFLEERLAIRAGDLVFDQCSGIGTLGIALAERGARVVGVDQARAYVERARREAEARSLDCAFFQGDAFEAVPARGCGAAFNWATSFGYAPDDRANARMLERALEALAPGGRFALDTMNVAGVLRDFQEHVVTKRETTEGELVLSRESKIDLARGVIDKRWTFFLPGGERVERSSSVRLYLPHSLREMLERAGFEDVSLHGSVRGEALELDSPRCIAVARRPA